jgi:23S rRNA pseudouridine1911/1915/1917 synthase
MPEGRSLLDWLQVAYPDTSRARARKWILAGRVSLGGEVVRQPHLRIPDPGDALDLRLRHAASLDFGSAWQIHPRVSLLYLDSALGVVNKAPGVISVPGGDGAVSALGIVAGFLAGRIRLRHGPGRSLPSAFRRMQPLPVHRLDQYTSGVFCMAMNPGARSHLIEQLKVHSMRREYVAYVEGRPQTPTGVWRQWLQLSRDELRQRVLSEAKAKAAGSEAIEAITHYEVMAQFSLDGGARFVTKLRLWLETGRKHQIRVQAANAGLPLVGDRGYNPAFREVARVATRIEFPRQALHAERLTLEHPDRPGSRMTWTAPLPADLRQLEARLRAGKAG